MIPVPPYSFCSGQARRDAVDLDLDDLPGGAAASVTRPATYFVVSVPSTSEPHRDHRRTAEDGVDGVSVEDASIFTTPCLMMLTDRPP
jgi:hypothetical protein